MSQAPSIKQKLLWGLKQINNTGAVPNFGLFWGGRKAWHALQIMPTVAVRIQTKPVQKAIALRTVRVQVYKVPIDKAN